MIVGMHNDMLYTSKRSKGRAWTFDLHANGALLCQYESFETGL